MINLRPLHLTIRIASALLLVVWAGQAPAQHDSAATTITVTQVVSTNVAPRVPAAGTVFSRNQTQITAGIAGRLYNIRRFDEAAARLFAQKPRGMIAVVAEGKALWIPVVQSESFGGRAEINGDYTENEAIEFSIILRSGRLPVPIRKED